MFFFACLGRLPIIERSFYSLPHNWTKREDTVRWLDLGVLLSAGLDFVAAVANCAYLLRWAVGAYGPARRLGAFALALVNAGLALEALAYLWLAVPASEGPPTQTVAVVLVRCALLASSALFSVLLLRDASR
jgi:hypothetical protein